MAIKYTCILLIFLLALNPNSTFAQKQKTVLHPISFKVLQDSMQTNPKPILVKIYTNWCVYCKMQDKQLQQSDSLKEIINSHFYYVELDAESKDTILFNGKLYSYQSNGLSAGINKLAEVLGKRNGQLNYPVTLILSSTYNILFYQQGLIFNKQLLPILQQVSN